MKKTLIALSVLVAAGTVNAATVYQNDGLSADVFADMEVRYGKAAGNELDSTIKAADYDFGFSVSSQVSEDMTVFGEASFNGDEQESSQSGGSEVTVDNGYMGVTVGELTVTAGRVVNFMDDVGVANDQTIAGLLTATGSTEAKTDQVLKAVYDNGNFYAGVGVTADNDNDDATEDHSQTDFMIGAVVSGADVRLTYATAENSDGNDTDAMALEVHYSVEGWDLGGLYTKATDNDVDSSAIAVSAQYTMDKTTVGGGFSTLDDDGAAAGAAESQWYANVSYALATNTSVYAEITDTDGDDVDMGYAVGAKIKF